MAADRILDCAYGKAPQAIALSVGGAGARPLSDFSDEELVAIIAGAQAAPPEAAREDEQLAPDPKNHLIHRPARDIIPPLGGARMSSYRIWSCTVFMLLLRPRFVPGSSGTRCHQPRCGA
jgi:hypothetical protein